MLDLSGLSVAGQSPVWVQKQLSSAVGTARCGLDTRLGPCVLHGVLWSNTSPPHYRPDGCLRTFYTLPKDTRTLFYCQYFKD